MDEQAAVLDGYRRHAAYDAEALRYREVLNYLHFAFWCRASEPAYTDFALKRAEVLVRDDCNHH
ncbi:MAG: hypothetical protein IT428_11150 [Planctomycetaceae bacterium]|nr:hypothetical protein [Planctomycetaceae bacterium]